MNLLKLKKNDKIKGIFSMVMIFIKKKEKNLKFRLFLVSERYFFYILLWQFAIKIDR